MLMNQARIIDEIESTLPRQVLGGAAAPALPQRCRTSLHMGTEQAAAAAGCPMPPSRQQPSCFQLNATFLAACWGADGWSGATRTGSPPLCTWRASTLTSLTRWVGEAGS